MAIPFPAGIPKLSDECGDYSRSFEKTLSRVADYEAKHGRLILAGGDFQDFSAGGSEHAPDELLSTRKGPAKGRERYPEDGRCQIGGIAGDAPLWS